ncbi:long-chain fatty acid--CoA ligase [Marinobacter lacisalsi]|uniref:Long-chain fatty acid--CoA ligase n=1 Tax=Marinobacter lacisalsi TaxID=475979 RepID=A0ABV8QGK3_9GAMM
MSTSSMPWLKSYPADIPGSPDLSGMPVHRMLENSAKRWPQRSAIAFMGRSISYQDLNDLVSRAASGFQSMGVRPGVHVGLYLPNTPHGIIAFFGVLRAGGVVVNYSPLDAPQTLEHKIGDSDTDMVVTLGLNALLPQMIDLLETTRLKRLVVGSVEEMSGSPESVKNALDQAGETATWQESDGRISSFAQLLDNNGGYHAYPDAEDFETLAVLQYTGGTTGAPKGAILTHGSIADAADQYGAALSSTIIPGEERLLAVLPPFHIYSIVVNMLLGLRNGATLYQMMRFDPKEALELIQTEEITVFPAVPTMLSALLTYPELEQYRLSSLKLCNSGGAPLPVELQQRFLDLAGCPVKEGWGMTETCSVGTITPKGVTPPPGSCGLPVPGVDLQILSLDDEETLLGTGERGELCIKGSNMMRGYWKRDDATDDSMTSSGFFRTGDIAYMDEDGFIYIVDRTKDMIICSGYNVYPRNIEEAIHEHPAIEEVSVIGIPDDYRGQSPKAFITIRHEHNAPSLEELQAFLKSRLGKHEMIRDMEVRDELPKTPVGKLSKKALYDEVAS